MYDTRAFNLNSKIRLLSNCVIVKVIRKIRAMLQIMWATYHPPSPLAPSDSHSFAAPLIKFDCQLHHLEPFSITQEHTSLTI